MGNNDQREVGEEPTGPESPAAPGAARRAVRVARDAGTKAAPVLKGVAAKTPTSVKKAATVTVRTSRDLVKQGVSVITFRKFREAVESTMADLVSVAAAQSAEIRRLRQRVEELERGR